MQNKTLLALISCFPGGTENERKMKGREIHVNVRVKKRKKIERDNGRIMNKIGVIIAKGENRKGQVRTTIILFEKEEMNKGDEFSKKGGK